MAIALAFIASPPPIPLIPAPSKKPDRTNFIDLLKPVLTLFR